MNHDQLAIDVLDYVTASPGATYQELAVSFETSLDRIKGRVKALRRENLVRVELQHGRAQISTYGPATWAPKPVRPIIHAVDLFCGAGGFSTGLAAALEDLGYSTDDIDLVGINHSDVAIATHAANHPWARHTLEDIARAQPRKLFPGGHLNLLLASPSCVHFSGARGGKPVNDQMRTHAWSVVRWCRDLDVDTIIVENVREFRDWGPVVNGKAVRDGSIFLKWIRELQLLGYSIPKGPDGKYGFLLNAADYGAATSRTRFFLVATKNGAAPAMPPQTHSKDAKTEGTKPWRGAREILDLNKPSQSIFERRKPLVEKTLKRIAEGIRRFNGIDIEDFLVNHYQDIVAFNQEHQEKGSRVRMVPFIVDTFGSKDNYPARVKDITEPMGSTAGQGGRWALAQPEFVIGQHGGSVARDSADPLPTVTTGGALRVVQPYILPPNGIMGGDRSNKARSIEAPMQTITAGRGGGHVVEPVILPHHGFHGPPAPKSIDEPLNVITAHGGRQVGLVQPHLVVLRNNVAPKDVDEPVPTIAAQGTHIGVAQPFVQHATHGGRAHDIDGPLPTVAGANRGELTVTQPFITPNFGERPGQAPRTHALDDPLPAVTGQGAGCVIQPCLVEYYGNGRARSIEDPLPTATTRERFAVVTPDGQPIDGGFVLDVKYRMLQADELAQAMGFQGYEFHGTKTEIVKQIGNAVEVNMAKALVHNALATRRKNLDAFAGRKPIAPEWCAAKEGKEQMVHATKQAGEQS